MNLNDIQFRDMHNKLNTEGGFSAHVQTGESPESGYMVSLPNQEKLIPSSDTTPDHIKDYATNAKVGNPAHKYIGGWRGAAGGTHDALDVSINVPNYDGPYAGNVENIASRRGARKAAMSVAQDSNQEAIWDVQRGKEIKNRKFNPDAPRAS